MSIRKWLSEMFWLALVLEAFVFVAIWDGVRYLITGGAGAPLRGERKQGGYYHCIHVDIKPERVTFTVMPIGSIITEVEVTPEILTGGGFLGGKKNVVIEFLRPPDHLKFVPKHTCRAVQGLNISGDLKDWPVWSR